MEDFVVDARGLYCPIPILRLAKAFRGKPAGAIARLLATDPAAVEDVEVFCRERDYALLDSRHEGETLTFRVQKNPKSKI